MAVQRSGPTLWQASLGRAALAASLVLVLPSLTGCNTNACNNECPSGYTCDAQLAECVQSTGATACTTNSGCPQGQPICVASVCAQCAASSDCTSGTACDLTTHTCQSGCQSQQDCTDPAMPECSLTGACVECISDLNCSEQDGVRRTCDPTTDTCLVNPCTADSDCELDPSGNHYCDTATGGCVACQTDAECGTGTPTPYCDPTSFQCVACVTTADCLVPGETCVLATNTCEIAGCISDASCPGDQHCDTSSGDCVSCLANADCDFGGVCQSSVCVAPASCTGDPQCLLGTYCVDGTCQACRSAADCAAGQSCVNGTCQAPASCASSAVCGPGFVCESTECAPSTCSAGTTPDDSPSAATPLPSTADAGISATLCPNETNYYVVAAAPGDGVQATLTYAAGAPPLSVELIPGPALTADAVASSIDNNGTTQATIETAPAGTLAVLVAVSGGAGQSVPYQLQTDVSPTALCAHDSRWPDETQAEAPLVTPGAYPGTLCPSDVEWFAINVPQNQRPIATLTSDASAADLTVEIFTTSDGTPTAVGYSETDGSGGATVTATTSAGTGGQEFWVEVINNVETQHQFTLNVALLANPPPNDLCANAPALTPNGTNTGTTLGATDDGTATCGGNGGDVFWTLTLAESSQVTLSATAVFNAVLSIASDCADDGELGCVAGTPAAGPALQFQALPAGTWIVRLAGATSADQGTYSISTQVQPAEPPTAATCAAPIALTFDDQVASAEGTVAGADDGVTSPCGQSGGDAVYAFTLAAPQQLTATLTGFAGAGLTLAPAASCSAPTGSECVAADANGNITLANNAVPAGDYVLIVDGGSAVAGSYSLGVTLASPIYEPTNDSCTTLIDLPAGPDSVSGDTRAAQDNFTPACGSGGGSGGVVYHVNVATEQQLSLQLSADYDAALSVTGSPCGSGTSMACEAGDSTSIVLPVIEPGDYYVWVDGAGTGTGTFTLTSDIEDPQPVPTNQSCDTAQAVDLSSGSATETGSTLRASNTLDPSDCLQSGATTPLPVAGPDVVYSVSIPPGMTLTATLNPTGFDGLLYALDTCSDMTCVAASDSFTVGGVASVQITNSGSAAENLFLVVGSWTTSASGDFSLQLALQ